MCDLIPLSPDALPFSVEAAGIESAYDVIVQLNIPSSTITRSSWRERNRRKLVKAPDTNARQIRAGSAHRDELRGSLWYLTAALTDALAVQRLATRPQSAPADALGGPRHVVDAFPAGFPRVWHLRLRHATTRTISLTRLLPRVQGRPCTYAMRFSPFVLSFLTSFPLLSLIGLVFRPIDRCRTALALSGLQQPASSVERRVLPVRNNLPLWRLRAIHGMYLLRRARYSKAAGETPAVHLLHSRLVLCARPSTNDHATLIRGPFDPLCILQRYVSSHAFLSLSFRSDCREIRRNAMLREPCAYGRALTLIEAPLTTHLTVVTRRVPFPRPYRSNGGPFLRGEHVGST